MLSFINNIRHQKYKNSKFKYFAHSVYDIIKPQGIKYLERRSMLSKYEKLTNKAKDYVDSRVEYYNKLKQPILLEANHPEHKIERIKDIKRHYRLNNLKGGSVYYFDSLRYLRCYNRNLLAGTAFGDVTFVPAQPAFLKSRPINGNNQNSVLLALDRVRHFLFINDTIPFAQKQDKLIGMTHLAQKHRQRFFELYFDHPMCHLGNINKRSKLAKPEWYREPLTIGDHLHYKFILCLEGHDVATNLKWVMSSNSLAVTTKPKYETWFMEGTLEAGVHYVQIKDDYSDLEEQLNYYIANPDKAQKIIDAAHEYISQFKNPALEKIISMRVVDKYFHLTSQAN